MPFRFPRPSPLLWISRSDDVPRTCLPLFSHRPEFRIRNRDNDFAGIQRGIRRTRATARRACVRCSSSKWRTYFCTTFGMVMRSPAVKFCIAIPHCFEEFCNNSIRQFASPSALPGGKNSIASSSLCAICRKSSRSEQTIGTP